MSLKPYESRKREENVEGEAISSMETAINIKQEREETTGGAKRDTRQKELSPEKRKREANGS
ncbi:hypothetical protein A946_06575 [Methylacidiphilum kamchatkense Kam1]|nr:hypothetical protein A946_06575 [Methylacidiphilum kamchatkense Kam1]